MNDVPLSIVVSLVSAALTAGVALGKIGAHTERLKSLERTRERIGARLEALERAIAVERVRSETAAGGHRIVSAAGVPHRIDDQESE